MRILKSAAVAVSICLMLASCVALDASTFKTVEKTCEQIVGSNSSSEEAAVILIAPTSSFTTSEVALEAAASYLGDSFSGKTALKTFLVSSDSKLASSVVIDLTNTISPEAKQKKIKQALELTKLSVACYQEGVTLSAELDLLSGIKAASASMIDNRTQKRILVFSNAIQTAGDLRLQESFEARPDDISKSLEDSDALPALDGIDVEFYGIGQTTGEQPVFSTKSINKLEEIWSAIISRAGGHFSNKGSIDVKAGNPQGPPIAIVSPLYVPPVVVKCSATLTDENLAFKADSADFISADKADETFKTLSQQFGANNCRGTISVSGFTTNFGTKAQQKQIATSRAKVVAEALSKLIPNMDVLHTGVGYDGTGDLDSSNRRVEVAIG